MALKQNYVDAVLNTAVNPRRKYIMQDNGDGTVSFVDATTYTVIGSPFGAEDVNDLAEGKIRLDTEATSGEDYELSEAICALGWETDVIE